jgi:hypothetical protein
MILNVLIVTRLVFTVRAVDQLVCNVMLGVMRLMEARL